MAKPSKQDTSKVDIKVLSRKTDKQGDTVTFVMTPKGK